MKFGITQQGPITTISLLNEQEIDLYNAKQLKDKLESLLEKHPKTLVFDMQNVSYMDSMGVASIVSVCKLCVKQNVDFVLQNVNHEIKGVFSLLEIDNLFNLFKNTGD